MAQSKYMKYNTFLGKRMAQSDRAITAWEKLMFRTDFKRIIEIGTFHGGFSLYLLLLTISNEAEFYTFDIKNWRDYDHSPRLKNYFKLDEHFFQMDIFSKVEFVKDLIVGRGITVLFCDGGNKEAEFNLFSPFLKKWDIIAVHDWKTETFPENLRLEGLEEIQVFDDEMTRFFRKI